MRDTEAAIASATPEEDVARELAALRAAFDESFAAAPASQTQQARDYVLVTAGGQGYALLAADLVGMEEDCPVVPVASAHAALAGIAGVRGAVVPVFQLTALLGGDAAVAAEERVSFALVRVKEDASGSQPGQRSHEPDGSRGPDRSRGLDRSRGRFGQEAQQVGLAFQTLERFLSVADDALYAPSTAGEAHTLADGDRLYRIVDVTGLVRRLTRTPAAERAFAAGGQEIAGAVPARAEDGAE